MPDLPADWPYDADRDDPLTKLRIPVVSSFNPRWKYVAAYLNVDPACKFDPPWPFASAERPTDTEAAMIASFIQEYLRHWFREGYVERLAQRALDVDGGNNTTVFIKYGAGDWGYRLCSWTYGPTFVPQPPNFPGRQVGPLGLVQVMDRAHSIGDEVMPRWQQWKADHPDAFAPERSTR